MPDTLAANIAESEQEIIETTQLLLPTFSPSMNLVMRKTIEKGHATVDLPAVSTVPSVQNPTEGEEVTVTYQYDLTAVTLTPVERSITVRVSKRAERQSGEDLIANISETLAVAQANDIEEDIISQFQNFNSANDLGGNTTDLTLATLRTMMRLLKQNTIANGGPAPGPISCVISPVAGENLMTDIGVVGTPGSVSPWIPAGISEEQIKQFGLIAASMQLMLIGSMVYISGAIVDDSFGAASGGNAAGMFAKKALWLAMAQDWDLETFTESEWLGPILRVYADFDTGVGPRDRWGGFILTDGT